MHRKLNAIDAEGKQYMQRAEEKCRCLKSGRIPFSRESAVWIERCQCYCSLLRWHARKIRSRRNLKRTSRRCNIANPFFLSVQEVKARLEVCKERCDFFRRHGKFHRCQHLNRRL